MNGLILVNEEYYQIFPQTFFWLEERHGKIINKENSKSLITGLQQQEKNHF